MLKFYTSENIYNLDKKQFSLKYVIVVFGTFFYWRVTMMSERKKVGSQRFNFNTWWGYTVALCLIISKPATQEKLNSFCPLDSEGRITKIPTKVKFSDYM